VHWSLDFRFLGTGEFAKVIPAGNGFIVPLSGRMFSAAGGHVIVKFYLAVKLKMELSVNVVSGKWALRTVYFGGGCSFWTCTYYPTALFWLGGSCSHLHRERQGSIEVAFYLSSTRKPILLADREQMRNSL
jgi:hypothetical protein